MITDRRYFNEDYIPETLVHRGDEETQLADALHPASHGEPADDVLITGPPGVGKTLLAKHALQRLATQADVEYVFVECQGKTTAGIIRTVLHELPGDDPAMNTPLEDLCLALRERVTDPAVIVLDEAAEVHDTKALKRLADVELVSLAVICYDADDWLAHASPRIAHRMRNTELHLDRYSPGEIARILRPRARKGLARGVWDRQQLRQIGDNVAGIARRGIYALLAAATLAEDRGHGSLQSDDIADADALAQEWMRQSALDSLPFHHHVLYELIRDVESIDASRLHSRYNAVKEAAYSETERTPLTKRGRRQKLDKLVAYDLIGRAGSTRDRTYWVCDGAVQSRFDIPTDRPEHSEI